MRPEVLVLGAGPAGSVLARRLACSGVRVALLGAAQRPGLEGVSDRSRALLAEENIESGASLLQGPFIRRGRWAGDSCRDANGSWSAPRWRRRCANAQYLPASRSVRSP